MRDSLNKHSGSALLKDYSPWLDSFQQDDHPIAIEIPGKVHAAIEIPSRVHIAIEIPCNTCTQSL